MVSKLIVVINGKGGTGKDTLCNSLTKKHRVMNVSAIDPIKEIARLCGWNGEKDDASRRFLAELKQAFINYNNLPTKYLKEKTEDFLKSSAEILFVHIREADQIEQYKHIILPHKCTTLLIKREVVEGNHVYGNHADDDVDNYSYDLVFQNDRPIEESSDAFCALIESIR